jgi:hypothetical protein
LTIGVINCSIIHLCMPRARNSPYVMASFDESRYQKD